jgi:hypothetical protein
MGGAPVSRGALRVAMGGRRKGAARRERQVIELRYAPSAREMFEDLIVRLQGSRPVLGHTRSGAPVFGAPTFRNVIDENGNHV